MHWGHSLQSIPISEMRSQSIINGVIAPALNNWSTLPSENCGRLVRSNSDCRVVYRLSETTTAPIDSFRGLYKNVYILVELNKVTKRRSTFLTKLFGCMLYRSRAFVALRSLSLSMTSFFY